MSDYGWSDSSLLCRSSFSMARTASRPARFAPTVDCDGPNPMRWMRGSSATCVPRIVIPPRSLRRPRLSRCARSARNPVAHRIASTGVNDPSASRTPSGSIDVNMGRRSSAPRSRAAIAYGDQPRPVYETTLLAGSPASTSAVTRAIVLLPSTSGLKPRSRNTGSRLVYQNVFASREISSSCCTAEMPPPTIATRCPANSSADT
ncbi:hypothetical protein ACFPRL_09445 [Pseudoclavibacter helvolus]